jgi:hypothetical protein
MLSINTCVEGKVMPLLVYAKEGVGVKRYSSGPTPLGYERSWKHEFKVTEFRVADVPFGAVAPEECSAHYPNCFLAWAKIPERADCEGTWKMLSPIYIPSQMPGKNRELLKITGAVMETDVGGWCGGESRLMLYVDGAKRWDSGAMPFSQNAWSNKEWSFSIPLGEAKNIDLWIFTSAWAKLYGGLRRHTAGTDGNPIVLSGRYFTDEPPPMADVSIRVLDRQKMTPVSAAYVALKVGDTVKGDGYTDSDGRVLFTNIEEGGYMLYVYKEGYHELNTGIDVVAPKVDKTVYLTPTPRPPIPWTWIAIGVGVVVAGGVAIAATRRKPEERVVVVR